MAAECRREELRCERGDDAVDPGDAGADGNQREHVELTRHERAPAAHEERPAGPQHDGRRECQLDDVRPCSARSSRQCRYNVRPFPARRPAALATRPIQKRRVMSRSSGLGTAVAVDGHGFERHAADRAGAGADLPDFRVHRAGVDRVFIALRQRRRCGGRLEIFLRIGGKFAAAAGRTKIVGVMPVIVAMPALRRIDRHAADRIGCGSHGVGRMSGMIHDQRP